MSSTDRQLPVAPHFAPSATVACWNAFTRGRRTHTKLKDDIGDLERNQRRLNARLTRGDRESGRDLTVRQRADCHPLMKAPGRPVSRAPGQACSRAYSYRMSGRREMGIRRRSSDSSRPTEVAGVRDRTNRLLVDSIFATREDRTDCGAFSTDAYVARLQAEESGRRLWRLLSSDHLLQRSKRSAPALALVELCPSVSTPFPAMYAQRSENGLAHADMRIGSVISIVR